MTINKYGVEWTVELAGPKTRLYDPGDKKYVTIEEMYPSNETSIDPIRYVFLKQGKGIVFLGLLFMDALFGPYISVRNVYKDKQYYLPQYQNFYAPELEDISDPKKIQWYRMLHTKHEKSMFKQYNDKYWYISITDLLQAKKLYNNSISGMFYESEHKQVMYVEYYHERTTLFINNRIYNKLPDLWTADDLYTLDKKYQDKNKNKREQLWQSIAEARAQHKPVRIMAYDSDKTPIIYTEKQMYGLILPDIQPYEEEHSR